MKENAKSGMTLKEIKAKLRGKFKESTTRDQVWDMNPQRLDKIDYLEGVLKKKSLLALETQQGVYKILDNLYSQEARSLKWKYVKSGFDISQTYNLDHASDYIDKRGELAEKMGDYQRAIKLYEQAEKLNEKAQRKGSGSWTPIHSKEDIQKLREKTRKNKTLEHTVTSILAIFGLGIGIFFLSSNITGNAIAEMTTKTTSFLGAGLIIVGLVAGFFWLKNRK